VVEVDFVFDRSPTSRECCGGVSILFAFRMPVGYLLESREIDIKCSGRSRAEIRTTQWRCNEVQIGKVRVQSRQPRVKDSYLRSEARAVSQRIDSYKFQTTGPVRP
jgi:hypothetical protein